MKFLFALCFIFCFTQTHHAQRSNYELVWSDEFDYNGAVDPEKWHHQTQLPNGQSWYNGEIQHYTDRIENAFVSEGTLKVMAKRETYTNQGVTKDFTSARLNSKFSFTYGKIITKAKLPFGLGTWPAIWMLGKNIIEPGGYFSSTYGTTYWPACGEVDIMEHWGNNQNYISSAIHTPSSYGGTVNVAGRYVSDVSNEFHEYTLEWDEQRMVFSVDNIVHYIYQPGTQNMETWPFDADQYMLFNVALLPEIISTNFTEDAMEVDYIRIYQNNLGTGALEDPTAKPWHPNPTLDNITLVDATDYVGGSARIYAIDGTLMQSFKVSEAFINLDMTPYSSGLYYIVLQFQQYYNTSKVIKL
ncbi:MAG: hypothetical protein ABR84_01920 [Cryomorphaceae bacterium BACL21 MAG-121220-bin10]|jgi:beta-glucanase (GH16 family)|nr:MAG: hypothetical protein ABR84_01920 [Cryomorphaceae bacterium BACL21 MAG-121220-bin10]MDB9782689.1 family 16 glycosylhydrolase [Winogradskyella sp.]MDB9782695.1 family 16 glycosylhydrolase [Winogradskyella sp.]